MPQVLIVDDEPDASDFVARYLTREGFDVRCAADGEAAMKELLDRRADAVVLDVRMPRLDGLSLLEILRSYLRWATLPVVILTAHATDAELARARALGVCGIFPKADFAVADLAACLRRAIPAAAAVESDPD